MGSNSINPPHPKEVRTHVTYGVKPREVLELERFKVSTMTVSPADFQAQVDRILNSPSWANADSQRALLRFLADYSLASPDTTPKEHEIAVKVLGKSVDFDPKVDPIVRVKTSRLRSKLAEYYVNEGLNDPIFLEVPKGAYCLQPTLRNQPQPQPAPQSGLWRYVAAVALFAAAAVPFWFSYQRHAGARRIWGPFLDSSHEVLAVFSNPKFVGSSNTGLRFFDPAIDKNESINGGYTGAGEVGAASALTRLFYTLSQPLRFKRAQIFTWDDARVSNLIFIGAGSHNVPVLDFPIGRKIRLKPFESEPLKGQGCVENLEPVTGEPRFFCTETHGVNSVEYAVVTFQRGAEEHHAVAVFAGQTTFGTQAAVEFFSDNEHLNQLAQRLKPNAQGPPSLEVVLRVNLRNTSPVSSEVVLFRQP